MPTVTHIAGNRIQACGRIIQRCSLCGAILCDNDGVMMPVGPDGKAPEFATWEVGRLVRHKTGQPERWTLLPDTDKLPDDSCFDLIEE